MRNLMLLIVLIGATAAQAQDGRPAEDPPVAVRAEASAEGEEEDGGLLKVVELKAKVRAMRRSIVGGGPAVEQAEREALSFYRRKIQQTASRIDDVRTERDAKDAEYRLALDATLEAEGRGADSAARRAARLRAEIGDLDAEVLELTRQRDRIGHAVVAIQDRMDRRKRVIAHFETSETVETMPFLGETVLGPDDDVQGGADPFENEELFEDLMRRDPDRARRILFERDPERYWKLFPLSPPESVLRKSFPYPSEGK